MYGDKIAIDLHVHHIETIMALLTDKVNQLEHVNELLDDRSDVLRKDCADNARTIAQLRDENATLHAMLAAAAKEGAHE